MISFGSDNHSGVHPKVLDAVIKANEGHAHSYGMDDHSNHLNQLFRQHFGSDVLAALVFTGTAANVISLKLFLESYESALVSDCSHLWQDECGAPEALAGVKLIPLATHHGKMSVESLRAAIVRRGDQHFSQPRLISLTQPTELGTLYSLSEIRAICELAREKGLFVHIDGTRLIHAATRLKTSLQSLTFDLGVDVVSFGGTKNGLLGAEAILIQDSSRREKLKYLRKQFLNLPSKSRFLAAQYEAYFENDLWREISDHSCRMADLLAESLRGHPEVQILHPVESNAVFVKVPKPWIKRLREKNFFYIWDESEGSLRWMMSYDVQPDDVSEFIRTIEALKQEGL